MRFLICFLLLIPVLSTAEPHPFTVHDLLAMDRISDPQVSADGSRIVFTLKSTDLEANKDRTDLWIIDSDGENLRQLTTNQAADFNPRWGPDGAIFFLSTRSGSSQVWFIDPDGGETTQMTDLPLDIGDMEVSAALQSFLLAI
ncbi:PD40 domain-containing protein, partial [bacterium]|nr:PD40 domain-containing protein [bacterium]